MDSKEKEAFFMFNWKAIIIGIVLSLILGIGLRFIIPSLSGIISIIIACAVVGYMAKGHIMNGAIHGGAVGAIEGIITIILVLYFSGGLAGNNNVMMILLIALIGDISLGIIGGTLGNILKMFSISKS